MPKRRAINMKVQTVNEADVGIKSNCKEIEQEEERQHKKTKWIKRSFGQRSFRHRGRVRRSQSDQGVKYGTGKTECDAIKPLTIEMAVFARKEIQIGELLGKGSFCEVYEVMGIQLERNVEFEGSVDAARQCRRDACHDRNVVYAIKVLKKSSRLSTGIFFPESTVGLAAAAVDLAKEAELLTSIHHENIIQIRGLGTHGTDSMATGCRKNIFYIMDRLRCTMDDRILEWKSLLPSNASLGKDVLQLKESYALQIAKALRYLHDNRIIFRDLKPANIGFQDDDTVKLFDFGLCRELPAEATEVYGECYKMSLAGSPRYVAPEVFITGQYNAKTDVYSWATVFYEMLTLVKPEPKFYVEGHKAHAFEFAKHPEVSNLCLPQCTKNLLINSWQYLLSQRFTMVDVCDNLEIILNDFEQTYVEFASSLTGNNCCSAARTA